MPAIVVIGSDNRQLYQGLAQAEARFRRTATNLANEARRQGPAIGQGLGRGISDALSGLGAGTLIGGGAFYALGKGISTAIGDAIDREALVTRLESITGSAAEAALELDKLQELAQKPGITLEAAADGVTRLRAVQIEGELARKTVEQFGNALALVGGTDLSGVTLAISQIAAKGKVQAEEINQIAERVPQIRQALKDAFGTADTDELQKQNLSTTQFLEGVIGALEKLPRAQETAASGVKNLKQSFADLSGELGSNFLPLLQSISSGLSTFARDTTDAIRTLTEQEVVLPDAAGANILKNFQDRASQKGAPNPIQQQEAEFLKQVEEAAAKSEQIEATLRKAALIEIDLLPDSGKIEALRKEIENIAKDAGVEGGFGTERQQIQEKLKAGGTEEEVEKNLERLKEITRYEEQIAAIQQKQSDALERQKKLRDSEEQQAKRKAERAAEEAKRAAEKAESQAEAKKDLESELAILRAKAAGDEKATEALEKELRVRQNARSIAESTGISESEAQSLAKNQADLEEAINKRRQRGGRINARSRRTIGAEGLDGASFKGLDNAKFKGLDALAELQKKGREGTEIKAGKEQAAQKEQSLAERRTNYLQSIAETLEEVGAI